jgi:hypothetical protein
MKTLMMLFPALAFVGAISMTQPAAACDYTHTTSAQSATVVACAGGQCEGQAPASQQGAGGTEAR